MKGVLRLETYEVIRKRKPKLRGHSRKPRFARRTAQSKHGLQPERKRIQIGSRFGLGRRLALHPQRRARFQSRELILVGHAYAISGQSGQIFRQTSNSDWGIDGEIEFKDYEGKASGARVYLQLKSGDSYLRSRKRDDKEIFDVKPRHAEYWQAHNYDVMLMIRTSDDEIRWMNATEYLKKHGKDTRQIIFDGEPFSALNVIRLRDKILGKR